MTTQPAYRFVGSLFLIVTLVAAALLLLLGTLFSFRQPVAASSHREAPLISKDPFADNTDTYVFISPEDRNNVVFVASWIPLEGPEGGPNYWEWDYNALYDIYIDNDGDASADITYTLSSRVVVGNPHTFLYNTGPINNLTDANWNRRQYITVTETTETDTTVLVSNRPTAPVNIGEKSTSNYTALEAEAIFDAADGLPAGVKIFAGQSDDPFFVDLQVFDLLTLRDQNPPIGYQANNIAVDSLSGFNVHTMVIEAPISRVKQGDEPVLGVWAGTRRPSLMVTPPSIAPYRQISRLGMPLVNEIVIPMGLKDIFNTLTPDRDLDIYIGAAGPTVQEVLQRSVEDPEVGRLLCTLYSVPLPGDGDDNCSTEVTVGAPRSGRGDIFDVFLTGMKLAAPFTINTKNGPVTLPAGFNVNQPAGVRPAEMIRINTDIKGDLCAPTPSRLGVLGGDACGFPNGRRLADDVVDIELLAVAGAAYQVLDGRDASFTFDPALIGVLTDGVDQNDRPFRNTFPYVAQAQSGQAHWHTNPFFQMLLPWIQKTMDLLSPGGKHEWTAAPLAMFPLLGLRRRQ
jgi:hypothetical protein